MKHLEKWKLWFLLIIGWIPIGTTYMVLAGFLMLFPRSLPRAAMRRRQMTVPPTDAPASSQYFSNDRLLRPQCCILLTSLCPLVSDFFQSIKRVFKNKIVLLDSLSSVCTKIGLAAFEIFLPKYIESQYGVSASDSSFLVGNSVRCENKFKINPFQTKFYFSI